jgi:hypothetical protein
MSSKWLGILPPVQDDWWDRRIPTFCYVLSGWVLALWFLGHWVYLPNWFSTLPSTLMSPVTLCSPIVLTERPTRVLVFLVIALDVMLLFTRAVSRSWIKARKSGVSLLLLCLAALPWALAERIDDAFIGHAIKRYDVDVDAIEAYFDENAKYPPALDELVPRYLPEVPGIYLAYGEVLRYDPDSRWGYVGFGPFTFELYGHDMSGWHGVTLKYCPIEDDTCSSLGRRIDDRWIWLYASAL